MKKINKQKGVALITALIISGIAVSLATLLIYRQQIQIRLTSNISTLEQTYLYTTGMEDFAGTILEKSFKDHKEYDSLLDDWHSDDGIILPITGGFMKGKLYDLQARINLNSLNRPREIDPSSIPNSNNGDPDQTGNRASSDLNSLDPNNPEQKFIFPADTTRQRLINLVREIDQEQELGLPENFSDILKDWIDQDQTNGNRRAEDTNGSGSGAETAYYQSIEPAYYSANTELISVTELRLLKDMTEELYKKLEPHVSTLPILFDRTKVETPINVNTASDEVLKAIGFTPDAIENINDFRKQDPFKKLEDFTSLTVVQNATTIEEDPVNGVDLKDLTVKSNYFLLQGSVEINNTRVFINSILERKNGQVSVIMRDFSNPETITKVTN